MDPRSESSNPMDRSKVPIVKLERCDKIWNTLQVIKHMQEKHLRDIENWIKREPITSEKIVSKQPPMTFIPDRSLPLNLMGEPDIPKPYIKYHPVLNNGNKLMPQFQLAEKRRVDLYHCEVCSKEFCDYKMFATHQDQLHGIILPKKIAPKRERLSNKSADSKNLQNFVESSQPQINKKLIVDENINLQNADKTVTKSIKCKLCHRFYRDLKKHTARYHKVRSIDSSSKVSDHNSNSEQVHSAMEIESSNTLLEVKLPNPNQGNQIISQNVNVTAQNSTNSLERKATTPKIEFRKKSHTVGNKKKVSKSRSRNVPMKCEFCHRKFVYYNSLCKHRYAHMNFSKDKQYLELEKSKDQYVDSITKNGADLKASAQIKLMLNNSKDNIGEKMSAAESRFTKELKTLTDTSKDETIPAKKNGKLKTKNKCLCGRSFRSSYILFTHKRNCKFLKNTDHDQSLEMPIDGDRDSGISIKIKKKNNSYEIVGKERDKGGDNLLCEETSDSSLNSSDSSEFDNRLENWIPEESKYSKEHKVLKIKLIEEDIDVEIEDELTGKHNSKESAGQVPSLRDLCKKFFIRRGLLPKQKMMHKCRFCQVFLGSKEKLSKHIEKHKKFMKRSCTCGIKFSSIETFDNHVGMMHPKCIMCPYCKERYKSIVEWDDHICLVDEGKCYTEMFNENHPCPNCDIVFNNITWLDSHLKSEHLDPNLPFQCYQCVEKFPNEIARSIHFHKIHNQASPCSVCNQKLQSIKTRQKHEAYHRGIGFPCHKCKKAYQSKRGQLYHIRTVHNEYSNDKIQCFICQKTMKTRSFKKHVLRHNSKLECKMCNKVLYDIRNLERHIMDHHREEDYPREKCNVCGVLFPTKEQLEAHIAVENSIPNEHKNVSLKIFNS